MSIPAVSARALTKHFSRGRTVVRAVEGMNFEIPAGTCLALLGPNGAGKTTTLSMMMGLAEPTSGELALLGLNWRDDGDELKRRIGVVLQDTRLSDRLTALEQVTLFGSFYGAKALAGGAALELVRLDDVCDVPTGKLSGGQRQRLALAVAMVGDPDILVLDEPTTGLDPNSRRDIRAILEAFKTKGKTLVLSTHAMDEASHLADRILFVDRGKIVADGTVASLTSRLPPSQIIDVCVRPELPRDAWTGEEVSFHGEVVRVTTHDIHATLTRIVTRANRAGARIESLSVRQRTLDEVFAHLTGRSLDESNEASVA